MGAGRGGGVRKLNVYLQEPNIVCGDVSYLPYSTGLLRAYAETDSDIRANVKFMPFIYEMAPLDTVLAKYTEKPDIACYSCSMWNENLELATAKEVKQRWPDCLIVFGGCQVPHHPKEYMEKYPFIDICVRGDGEEAFKAIIQMRLGEHRYKHFEIPSTSWRRGGEIYESALSWPFSKDLDKYPSPYAIGLFGDLIQERKEGKNGWQAIIETNRGCPF